jgi:hypothetical protein
MYGAGPKCGQAARRATQNPTLCAVAVLTTSNPRRQFCFEAYAADDRCLGVFPTPRKAADAITLMRPWANQKPPEQTPTQSADSR